MPEEKKPWEQDLVTEEKSSAKKPWEQEFEASEAEKKKLETIPSPSVSPSASPLLNTASPLTAGESASSGKYNFATGENQLPPFYETDFEKRIKNPVQFIENSDGTKSTHKMMSFESDGKYYAAPTIVNKNGKLVELPQKDAIDYALKNNEFKEFKTDKEAQKYAEGGYKIGSPLAEPLPQQVNQADLLRAAPSTGETTPKDISNYNPVTPEQREKENPLESNLARGVAQAVNYAIKAPAGMYDMIALAGNKLINNPLNAITNNAFGEIPSFKQLGNEDGLYKSTVRDIDEAIQKSSQVKQDVRGNKKIQDYFSSGEYSKGFSLLGEDLMEMIPTSVALGFAVAQNPAMANTIGGGAFIADAKSKLDANPNLSEMPEQEKSMWAGLMGGTEMASENLGIPNLPIFKDVLKKGGKEALDKAGKEFFNNTMGRILKRYIGPASEEIGTELLNNTLQNIYAAASGDDPDRKPFDNSMDTFIKSAGLTGALSGPTLFAGTLRTKEAIKRTAEIEKHKSILGDQLQNPDVSETVKPALANRIQDLNEEASNISSDEKQKFDALPEDKKTEVDNLLKKSHDIATSAVDETISTDTKEIFKRDIDNIDEKIDSIYEEAEKEREQAATEKGLVKGEKKSEPIDLSIDIEELPMTADKENEDWMKSFEESIKPQETPVESITPKTENNAVQEQGTGEVLQRQPEKTGVTGSERKRVESSKQGEKVTTEIPEQEKVKEKPVQELIDEQEQLEAKKEDDQASVKKLNDDIEILKKFDKPDIASKKFSAILERAFKMKEEGKISKPTYTAYRNAAQQVLGPKISVDAEQAKFKIETLKENIKKKLLGEGYKKIIMSAPGFGPKQVADLIDLTAKAAQKAIDAGFTIKEAVTKALTHIKNHPQYAKLIKEGHLDEETFTKSVSDTFAEAETKTEEPTKKEESAKKEEVKPDSEERKLSGIKKALVSDEIIQGVDLEKISDKEMQETAKKLIDTGEVKPENIVNEVLIKHRALQPKEVVGLIYYKTELDNELRDAYQEKEKLIKDGEPTGAVEANIVNLEQKRTNYDMVSVITASQQSLAFRLRKGLRDSDFNLVEQIARYKATNNGEISPEVEARFRELEKEYKQAIDKVQKLEKEAEENEIDKAHRNIIEDIERAKGNKKNYTQKSKELADKVRKLKGKPLTFTTKDGKEVPIKKQGIGTDAILEIAARTIETTGKVIDGVNAVIKQVKDQDWYKALSKEDKDGFAKQLHERFGEDEKHIAKAHVDDEGKLVIPHSLIRSIYESGITDINKIVEAVQKELDMPEITDRQIRDAITRYGKTVNLNKDEIEAGIRQAKRIGKLISQLEDIKEKERPKRSGLQRDKPSDEERRLMKEVKREMKSLPEDPEEDARALKSALEATKTRLKNRIKDLENQLATGEKTPKSKGVELDAEAKELKEKVEKLRAELESVEGKPKISDEQRLARMKTYTQNRIKDLEAKIKKQDFSKPEKRKPISDNELTKARGELADKRDEWEKLQYENELKNRTKWQKAGHLMMGALNIPRAFKLGFDLSAVGVQGLRRLSTSPVQSAKAFKDMMQQTFSEEKQKEWLKTLKGQDIYPTLKAAGAAFTELDGKISVREENFSNDLVKHAFKFVFNKKLGLDKVNPYEASNRAFSGYLNSIRLQGYLEGFKMLERKGKTFESHPQDYKSWVKYINNITGRGSLGKKGNSSELAQFVFTSPRKMISEANLINPHFWGNVVAKDTGKDYDYQLTPTVARMALTDFAMGMGITAVVAALARAAFSDKDDKHDKDFYDPRSSNFSGIKIRDEHGGFTMVHPFAAYKTEGVLLSRLLSNQMANTRTGKVTPLGKGGAPKGNELIANFFQNKLSPTLQVPLKMWKDGEKYDAKTEALKTIEPATLEGFLQTYKDYPTETEAALTALAFFGIAETHIEKKKR